jgi:murein DD-endopeptidase MepM/ murein hydrolase activator NlpD
MWFGDNGTGRVTTAVLASLLFVALSDGFVLAEDRSGAPSADSKETSAAGRDFVMPHRFRWPVRGRIIVYFKSGSNDGVDISAPVGEPVHAAADGIVTYAGDELKTYGKLILIRHADDFVSAYANNSELDVASGDSVKRGQIIAKSGQPAAGGSPRLHFELRKGGKPVDPTQYLAPL